MMTAEQVYAMMTKAAFYKAWSGARADAAERFARMPAGVQDAVLFLTKTFAAERVWVWYEDGQYHCMPKIHDAPYADDFKFIDCYTWHTFYTADEIAE